MTIINYDQINYIKPLTLRKILFFLKHPSLIYWAVKARKTRYYQIMTVRHR